LALKASCTYCKKSFSAPDDYRGRKIDCPSCGRRFLVQTEEDILAAREREAEVRRGEEEDRDRIALIERMDSRGRMKAGKPYYEEFQTGAAGVRHFNPRAPSRFLRFRTLSDFLVLGAYVELLLVAVGIGLMIYLKVGGLIESVSVLFVLIVGWLVVGVGLYLFFKYLGELAFLLADVGDQQNDLVQLLLDIRDNTDENAAEGDRDA
jgi:DNA-directed RNA polymerase subunit RPC12/RpoP